ncbi:hypothetical protein CDL15_Pgr014991 [Punica granatum]|uniref:Uncharacterized protein n=1 Tax=Punica granatum TaxID=22663 RepID=A0A218X1F3_PUNGR|nr:hypothetical protein CDL15_Pgr014991 [Punica granatum]
MVEIDRCNIKRQQGSGQWLVKVLVVHGIATNCSNSSASSHYVDNIRFEQIGSVLGAKPFDHGITGISASEGRRR